MCNSTRNCCFESANKNDAHFCETCGDPVLRCANHPNCGGLLTAEQYCPVCFAPELKLLAEQETVSVGQSAHVKMELANRSPSTRFLEVKQAWIRVGKGDWTPIELSWDQIEMGQSKPLRFTTRPLETGGVLGAEVVLVLGAKNGIREEAMAFSANFTLTVEDKRDVVVQQNIHYAADAPQNGATIYAPVRVQGDQETIFKDSTSDRVLELHRATRYETGFGVRSTDQPLVGPLTQVDYEDNKTGTRVTVQHFAQRRSQLVFGRARTWEQGGTNDIRVLFVGRNGDVDETESLQISREHFCMYADRGVLHIRPLSNSGIRFDGKTIFPGDVRVVGNGSRIEICSGAARINMKVTYFGSGNEVERVLIQQV